jgi:hypothetical protein
MLASRDSAITCLAAIFPSKLERQLMRQKQMLRLKAKGEKLIPAAVIEKLAALNLPPNVNVFGMGR